MNSKAQVKGKLGDVVQIHVCRPFAMVNVTLNLSIVGSLFLVHFFLFSDFSVVCITSFGDRAAVRKMERRTARIHRFKPSYVISATRTAPHAAWAAPNAYAQIFAAV